MGFAFATSVTKDSTNYYNILEVDEGATEQDIRSAYAELTRGLIP
jgi:DnaJ-class molecular chaperone